LYLVDTSVWIDHFRRTDPALVQALEKERVVCHPHIVGELALGSLKDRTLILAMLRNLPSLAVADDVEMQHMIESHKLQGRGIGFIDAHLLASVLIDATVKIWTADRRLADVAAEFGLAARGCD